MKLLYNKYRNINDENMSDFQVGTRKDKNIGNHIWILNGVINDSLKIKKKKTLYVQIVDVKQCFDGLWP